MNKNEWIAVFVGLGFLVYLFYGNLVMSFFKTQPGQHEQIQSGVDVQDIVTGQGEPAINGDVLTVHYIGTLPDGKVFDSSVDRNTPYTFQLGMGQVIKGWDAGLLGMRVGGKRRLVIAPDYAYGPQGYGVVPPNTLIQFDVELLNIQKPNIASTTPAQ